MAVRGAIHIDEAATDYHWRLVQSSAHTNPAFQPANVASKQRVTWGKTYSAGVTGWEVVITCSQNGAGVLSQTITITTPWGNYTATVVAWPGLLTVTAEADDVTLDVNSDCSWTFEFSALRFYVDGGAAVLTIGAQSVSGTTFNLRKDICCQQAAVMVGEPAPICENTETPAVYGCATNFAGYTPSTWTVTNSVTGGWQWWSGTAWVSDPVRLLTVTPPTANCDCGALTPTWSEADSYALSTNTGWTDATSKASLQTVRCECVGGYEERLYWKRIRDFTHTGALEVGAMPETSGILVHTSSSVVACEPDDIDTGGGTTTEAYTYCEVQGTAVIWQEQVHCYDVLNIDPCTVLPGDPDPLLPCWPVYNDKICCTTTTISVTWPNLPPCTIAVSLPWSLQDHFERVHLATVVNADVWYQRAAHTVPLPSWDFFLQMTSLADVQGARMAYDPVTERLFLLIERLTAGAYNLYESYSDDDGASWSTPTLFMANARFGVPWTGSDGSLGYSWFEYDAGTSGPGKQKGKHREAGDTAWSATFTFKDNAGVDISVADGGWSNVEDAKDSIARLTWCPIKNGDSEPTFYWSTDAGRTWAAL